MGNVPAAQRQPHPAAGQITDHNQPTAMPQPQRNDYVPLLAFFSPRIRIHRRIRFGLHRTAMLGSTTIRPLQGPAGVLKDEGGRMVKQRVSGIPKLELYRFILITVTLLIMKFSVSSCLQCFRGI